jgi:hypothetical protein
MPPHRPPRDAASAIVALAVGLAVAAILHGPGVPPVYDGIATPPEPYRWESPPPNLKAGNKPPLAGESILPVLNAKIGGGSVKTGDGQAIIYFGVGAFVAPAGATSVECTITPDPNPPAPAAGIDIRGNVYRIGCVGQPGGGRATVTSSYRLTMRFPPGAFTEIRYNEGSGWRPLPTVRDPGGNPYAGVHPSGFGEFAATAPTGAPGDSIFAVLGRYVEFYGILAFVIVFGLIAIIQEVRRRRRREPAAPRKKT